MTYGLARKAEGPVSQKYNVFSSEDRYRLYEDNPAPVSGKPVRRSEDPFNPNSPGGGGAQRPG